MLLSAGYGDISASTPLEQATVVCAVIIGVLFIGYAIKSLMDILVEVALQVSATAAAAVFYTAVCAILLCVL